VADVAEVLVSPNLVLSFAAVGSRFVPVIVTAVPGAPTVGLNEVIVGAPVEALTVKAATDDADPFGEVTEIGPVVAPDGTVTTSVLAVADEIVAAMPLKVTESCDAVEL
jgi:hypothetical protein